MARQQRPPTHVSQLPPGDGISVHKRACSFSVFSLIRSSLQSIPGIVNIIDAESPDETFHGIPPQHRGSAGPHGGLNAQEAPDAQSAIAGKDISFTTVKNAQPAPALQKIPRISEDICAIAWVLTFWPVAHGSGPGSLMSGIQAVMRAAGSGAQLARLSYCPGGGPGGAGGTSPISASGSFWPIGPAGPQSIYTPTKLRSISGTYSNFPTNANPRQSENVFEFITPFAVLA